MTRCFFAGHNPCDGQLVRGHLIPRQLLKREFPHGVVFDHGEWRRLDALEDVYHLPHRTLRDLIDDERSWVPMCGGPMGNGGHHGQLDQSRTLRIPREELPEGFMVFCEELGLGWYVLREYGDEARAA